jgi:hypothetical protein
VVVAEHWSLEKNLFTRSSCLPLSHHREFHTILGRLTTASCNTVDSSQKWVTCTRWRCSKTASGSSAQTTCASLPRAHVHPHGLIASLLPVEESAPRSRRRPGHQREYCRTTNSNSCIVHAPTKTAVHALTNALCVAMATAWQSRVRQC